MRNLDILTKFSTKLEGITIVSACLDEFGHMLFVYSSSQQLHIYKYNVDKKNPDIPSILEKKTEVEFSDQDPTISESKLIAMDYI